MENSPQRRLLFQRAADFLGQRQRPLRRLGGVDHLTQGPLLIRSHQQGRDLTRLSFSSYDFSIIRLLHIYII